MANRERKNELKIYLSDDEQYIPDQKVKASGMKSKSVFLRRQILYGFVYDIDYSELRKYNAALGRIGNNLNQIAKRMNAKLTLKLCRNIASTIKLSLQICKSRTSIKEESFSRLYLSAFFHEFYYHI